LHVGLRRAAHRPKTRTTECFHYKYGYLPTYLINSMVMYTTPPGTSAPDYEVKYANPPIPRQCTCLGNEAPQVVIYVDTSHP